MHRFELSLLLFVELVQGEGKQKASKTLTVATQAKRRDETVK